MVWSQRRPGWCNICSDLESEPRQLPFQKLSLWVCTPAALQMGLTVLLTSSWMEPEPERRGRKERVGLGQRSRVRELKKEVPVLTAAFPPHCSKLSVSADPRPSPRGKIRLQASGPRACLVWDFLLLFLWKQGLTTQP